MKALAPLHIMIGSNGDVELICEDNEAVYALGRRSAFVHFHKHPFSGVTWSSMPSWQLAHGVVVHLDHTLNNSRNKRPHQEHARVAEASWVLDGSPEIGTDVFPQISVRAWLRKPR